jgi:hypothetical protein
MCLLVYQKQLESNYMVPPPPTLRVKCRVLKIGKCTWSGCHVVTSPKLQVDWINAGVVYIWKSTQVPNNHVREFESMPLPSRTLRSNLITLVWLIVPIWNPIALSLCFRLASSQMVGTWWYTKLGPSPWRRVFLGRKQRWAKHLLIFLLCSQETNEVFLTL